MREGPLFTVIVATYRRPRYLQEALHSVLRQTVQDLEVIVVDDASPQPATVPGDPRIRLIRRERNGGAAAAWNTALELARGRFVTFLGDDDLYEEDRLAMSLDGVERAPITICWSRFLGRPRGGGRVLEGDVRDTVLDGLVPSLGATTVHRTSMVAFDERFRAAQDVDWWLRVASRGDVATVRRCGYVIRQHGGARHGNDLAARIRSNLLLMEMHEEYFSTHPRALAFRWKRIGLMAQQLDDHRAARSAFLRSLRLKPEPASAWHLVRSLGRGSSRIQAAGVAS